MADIPRGPSLIPPQKIKKQTNVTGNDTNAAKFLRTESFKLHPLYDSVTQENDIAVVRVSQDIEFNLKVGPVCLPFRFSTTAVGTKVTVLGKLPSSV
jgi:trypsin